MNNAGIHAGISGAVDVIPSDCGSSHNHVGPLIIAVPVAVNVSTSQPCASTSCSSGSSYSGLNLAPMPKRKGIAAGNNSSASLTGASSQPPQSMADFASLFECPVCLDYVLPPILQCHNGHLLCSSCRPKCSGCPTCRGPLGNIRNLAMEKVATTVLFPCKYTRSGCFNLLSHQEKAQHEVECEFRPYNCPFPGATCKWAGDLEYVKPHLSIHHRSITTLQGEDIVFLATDINLPGAVDWVMIQSCFNQSFMLVLEKQTKPDGEQQFFALVQLIGCRKEAENYNYRLELNGKKRRLTWEGVTRSIHEGVGASIKKSDCLVFQEQVVQIFSENGNLGINVTISMA